MTLFYQIRLCEKFLNKFFVKLACGYDVLEFCHDLNYLSVQACLQATALPANGLSELL